MNTFGRRAKGFLRKISGEVAKGRLVERSVEGHGIDSASEPSFIVMPVM